ncbi:MAG: hypothetical protein AB7V50_10270 [Vampirovibrionia bacterium]
MTPIDELKIFCTSNNNFTDAVKILNCAPLSEITIVLDKINYYLEHINILDSLGSPNNDYKTKTKKEFLQSIQEILLTEIERRKRISL